MSPGVNPSQCLWFFNITCQTVLNSFVDCYKKVLVGEIKIFKNLACSEKLKLSLKA